MLSLLLVLNVVFAAIALVVGFALGAWVVTVRKGSEPAANTDEVELERQKQMEREKAVMATERLRDLASGVASDVGEHSSAMGEITAGLRALDTTDSKATGAGLVDALSKIVAANETLQERLNKAEEQIAAQAQEIHLHESEARTDSLTGLANRRAFDDEMRRRCSEAQRKGTPVSLLIMDIDYFKRFNDTHGHQAGDEVLRAVGQKLVQVCRDMDLPCRYGGEEFAVVMPATGVQDAKTAAERVRIAVESMSIEFEGKKLKVTTSIGLAQYSSDDDIARLVRRADEALYASKDAGRNCGHWHDGQEPQPLTPKVQQVDRKRSPKRRGTQFLDSLPNRTKFAEELRRRMAESGRTDQALAVLIVELDGYQALREKLSAEVACTALDAVASVLHQSLREMDLLARLSESRFAVMLPASTMETADFVASRATESLQQSPFEFENQTVDVKLITGISHHKPGDSVEELVGRAEAELNDQTKEDAEDPELALAAR